MRAVNIVLAFAILLGCSTSIFAQPGYISGTSLDSMVVNSDHVFIGTIRKFEKQERKEGSNDRLLVWFAIEETLKSPQSVLASSPITTEPYTCFFQPLGQFEYYDTYLPKLKEQRSRLLVAVGGDTPFAIDLDHKGQKVLTSDFEILEDADAVIQAAKEAIARVPPNVRRIHTLTLWKPEAIELDLGQPVRLNVPVDERLEKRTHSLLASESPKDRIAGLEAIRYFKTDENIAKAKNLLTDPYQEKRWDTQTDDLKPYLSYLVRVAAWDTFRAWGIKVEKPVLRKDIKK